MGAIDGSCVGVDEDGVGSGGILKIDLRYKDRYVRQVISCLKN